ncbi:hypothetical protein K0M31_019031, partial [Melipona bicolor]
THVCHASNNSTIRGLQSCLVLVIKCPRSNRNPATNSTFLIKIFAWEMPVVRGVARVSGKLEYNGTAKGRGRQAGRQPPRVLCRSS